MMVTHRTNPISPQEIVIAKAGKPVAKLVAFEPRKERRQRGGVYWSGYRRQGRRLRKHYLGRSAELTQARLAQVAALWETGADPPD